MIAGTGAESTRGTIELSRQRCRRGRRRGSGAAARVLQGCDDRRGSRAALQGRGRRGAGAGVGLPGPVAHEHAGVSDRACRGAVPPPEHRGHQGLPGKAGSGGRARGALVRTDFQVLVGSGAILYAALETGAVGGIVAVGLAGAPSGAAEITVAYRRGTRHRTPGGSRSASRRFTSRSWAAWACPG